MSHIRVEIANEDELFDRFDADRNMLSDGFISFMKKQYREKREDGVPTIRFISPAPLDEARIEAALRNYIQSELKRNRSERRRNRFSELYLFLLGIACIVAGILLQKLNVVYLQILSLTAGFAIKEAATIFFMKNPRNTFERAMILFISGSKLEFERKDEA